MNTVNATHPSKELDTLRRVLASQQVAVLATSNEGQPYCTLVGFSVSNDLKSLFFATPRTTRKFAYIQADGRVSMSIDDRASTEADFFNAVGITACGRAEEYPKDPKGRYLKQYRKKHPYLEDFVRSPQCAFIRVRVEKYVIVRKFQEVVELVVR